MFDFSTTDYATVSDLNYRSTNFILINNFTREQRWAVFELQNTQK